MKTCDFCDAYYDDWENNCQICEGNLRNVDKEDVKLYEKMEVKY